MTSERSIVSFFERIFGFKAYVTIAFDPESAPFQLVLGQSRQDMRHVSSDVWHARPRDGFISRAAEGNLSIFEVEGEGPENATSAPWFVVRHDQ